ncbi:hypothetical protein SMICM17S_01019 [Streptomyces microflavus]
MEVDAALGESEVFVHAEQGGEHAGRLVLSVGFQVGERCAVQVLDPSGYLGGREVGQAGAFTVGGPGPPLHAGVPGRPRRAGSRWPGAAWCVRDGLVDRAEAWCAATRPGRRGPVAGIQRGFQPLRVEAELVRRQLAHVAVRVHVRVDAVADADVGDLLLCERQEGPQLQGSSEGGRGVVADNGFGQYGDRLPEDLLEVGVHGAGLSAHRTGPPARHADAGAGVPTGRWGAVAGTAGPVRGEGGRGVRRRGPSCPERSGRAAIARPWPGRRGW